VTACLAEGISVNVTLIFSPERYGAGLNAFLMTSGSRRFPQAAPGRTPRRTWRLHGQAAVANARLSHALCKCVFR